MPFYIGEKKMVDRYIGDKLVIAAYKGESKYFDAYSEITGTLPVIFKSRAAVALKNYRIYGTSEGAGVETKNIFNPNAKDTSNGFVANARLRKDGVVQNYTGSNITEYIPITPGENYYIWSGATLNLFGGEIYDENKVRTRGAEYELREFLGFTARAGEAYVRFTYWAANDFKTALYKGSNSQTFIPHGYELPLTITDGEQSRDIPIYIGSTKLGEEEYVDYESGKVYKRTKQLLNQNAKDASNGYMSGRYLTSNGGSAGNSALSVSEYIAIEENTAYTVQIGASYLAPSICFYDTNKAFISSVKYDGKTTLLVTSPADAAYARMSFRTATTNALNKGSEAISINTQYIAPTDPPVHLPEINTYQGENTLSSTETLGEATIKGRINELPNTP